MTLTTRLLAAKGTVPAGAFFGVAGCVVSSSGLKGVVRAMHKAKASAGLQPDDPVKHSMDNEIRRIYLDLYGAKNGDAQYKAARSNSKAIGRAARERSPTRCSGAAKSSPAPSTVTRDGHLPDRCVARDVPRDRRRGTPSGRRRARSHRLTPRLGRDVPAETTTRRRIPHDDRWQLVPLAMHRSMYVWSVAGAHPLLNPP
jgi:hypothetical protein